MQHRFLDQYSDIESFIHRLDPRTKLLCLAAFVVVVVSTPPDRYTSFAAYAIVILGMSLLSRIPLGYILKRSGLILPFTLLAAAFVPFWSHAQPENEHYLRVMSLNLSRHGLLILASVLIKSWLAIVAMILLSSSTRFSSVLAALSRLRFPLVLIMILSFMYRYSFVVSDEAMRMRRAWQSRYSGRRRPPQVRVASLMIGLLFIRAYERAERVYHSMVTRGFDGRIRTLNQLRLSVGDVLFVIPFVVVVAAIRLWSPR